MNAELAARVTAAQAALGDFRHEVDSYIKQEGTPAPHWQEWAFRLSTELRIVLAALDGEDS